MSTITENIIALTNQRLADRQKVEDAKAAIRLKGVTVPVDDKLGDLDDRINLIVQSFPDYEWTTPSDWIQLETPNDNEILLLASDINPHYGIKVEVVGGYTVDWGDNTINNWASGAIASHSYAKGDGQACSRGYTTFKIRIYAQVATNNITLYRTLVSPASMGGVSNGLLWAKFGTRNMNCSELFGNPGQAYVSSFYIESIELPQDMNIRDLTLSCVARNCISLIKFEMPRRLEADSTCVLSQSFDGTKVKYLNFSAIDTLLSSSSSNSGSLYLKKIIPPKKFNFGINGFSGFGFSGCDLGMLNLPDTVNNTTQLIGGYRGYGINFNTTGNLSYENKIITLNSFFTDCFSLYDLTFVDSVNLTNGILTQMMYNCYSIKSFHFPDNIGVPITGVFATFRNCYNLETIENFPALNSVADLGQAFMGCYSLKNIDNLDQLGDETTEMDLSLTYRYCYSLNPTGGLRVRNKITGRFVLTGGNSPAALQSLLFTNQAAVSTWGGSSPQIDVAYCSMDATALNALFESIIATSVDFGTKTIRITGNPGANTCDTSIITDAGGTVNLLT